MIWAITAVLAVVIWVIVRELIVWLGLESWLLMDCGGRFLTSSGAWSAQVGDALVFGSKRAALDAGIGTPVRVTRALLTPG